MTPHDFDHHFDFDAGGAGFDLNRPGALIAALPAILGFTPEKSLIVVSVDRGQLGAVLRVDLGPDLRDGLEGLVSVTASARPEAAIAIIVDPEGALCPMCNDEHRRLCTALADELDGYGIPLWAAHLVDRVGAGGRWHCVDGCGSRGRVDDPEASPVTVAAVLDGRRLYGRRADLESVIAVTDISRTQRVAEALAALQAGGCTPDHDDPADRAYRAVQDGLDAITRIEKGETLTDAEIAVVAHGLADLRVRDTMYALAVGERAAAAETLWATLARLLPAPWRVEALVQLAFSAYVRGDGPLTGVALEAALRVDPTHRMGGLLDAALQSGMRPEQIRELALTGYRLADELGVVLPPRQAPGRRAG
ncbi:DUF4192 domain-containing protein [Mycolicibacterium mengxianglii]|uniref:DUF4192 domain-containing protein n=1 Tax=Mycolicibacterium mengxianglii TaxID=2736649 RepID=UPI0018EED372|nr:DUF4192 domain-containing protein [Mycolicibacterium mengxianglii]